MRKGEVVGVKERIEKEKDNERDRAG